MEVLLEAARADAAAAASNSWHAAGDLLHSSSSDDESTSDSHPGYTGKWSFHPRFRAEAIAQEVRRRERWRQQTRSPDEDDECGAKRPRYDPPPATRKRATPAWRRSRQAARERYASSWGSLADLVQEATPCVCFSDIPWPALEPVRDIEALSRVTIAEVEEIVIPDDAQDVARRKRALVGELRRWHPDKFTARWGQSLVPGQAAAVLDGVKQVSQSLNELLEAQRTNE